MPAVKPQAFDVSNQTLGHIRVLDRAPDSAFEACWNCLCTNCDRQFTKTRTQIKYWVGFLRKHPNAFIGCAVCHRKHKNDKRSEYKSPSKSPHVVNGGPNHEKMRAAIPTCSECANIGTRRHWHNPCPGTMSITGEPCGNIYEAEKPIRAVGRIGSAGALCVAGVGYQSWGQTT